MFELKAIGVPSSMQVLLPLIINMTRGRLLPVTLKTTKEIK